MKCCVEELTNWKKAIKRSTKSETLLLRVSTISMMTMMMMMMTMMTMMKMKMTTVWIG